MTFNQSRYALARGHDRNAGNLNVGRMGFAAVIRKRDVELAAADEARKLGIVVEFCGKNHHWNLIVYVGQRSRKIGISCTPKDGDNLCNWVRQDIRKCYRELMQ